MADAVSLSRVIGANVRRLRTPLRLSQEDLARELRRRGVEWDRSQLAKAERGQREFTVNQLVVLGAVLDTTAEALLQPGNPRWQVRLTRDATIRASTLRNFFDPGYKFPERDWSSGLKMAALDDPEAIRRAAGNEVERRVAFNLDMKPEVLARTAHRLYGRSFVEERNRRVSLAMRDQYEEDTAPRTWRARFTRELIEEVRAQLDGKGSVASKEQPKGSRRSTSLGKKR